MVALTDEQLDEAIRDYDWQDLPKFRDRFEWGGKKGLDAIKERNELEASLLKAVATFNRCEIRYVAERIHKWGFNGVPLPNSCGEPWLENLCALYSALSEPAPLDGTDAFTLLIGALSFERIKLAKVSKWVCFLDQSRFAIFDSRVSLALRHLSIERDGMRCRLLPIVGRRNPTRGWHGDNLRPEGHARSYCLYLRIIHLALKSIRAIEGWRSADVEMALFMKGDETPGDEVRLPLWRSQG